jgi:hypothetical protein
MAYDSLVGEIANGGMDGGCREEDGVEEVELDVLILMEANVAAPMLRLVVGVAEEVGREEVGSEPESVASETHRHGVEIDLVRYVWGKPSKHSGQYSTEDHLSQQ